MITQWRLTNGGSEVTAQILKVVRPTADPKAFRVVAESAFGAAVPGPNTFDTRLPVQAGDKFGLYGLKGAIACAFGTGADKLGFTSGNSTIGTTLAASVEHASEQIPVSVVIEPDADHDGYGDETQDNCPESPAAHVECPLAPLAAPLAVPPVLSPPETPAPLTIEALPQVRERSANMLVTASVESSVVASGTVKLGKGAAGVGQNPAQDRLPRPDHPVHAEVPAEGQDEVEGTQPGAVPEDEDPGESSGLAGTAGADPGDGTAAGSRLRSARRRPSTAAPATSAAKTEKR